MVEFKEISEPKILSGLSSPIYIDKVKLNKKIVTRSLKRIIDFFGSALGLVILSPVFLIIVILMKIEEPKGPIFFSQERIGKNLKPFKMFKFRSMCVGAEDQLVDLLKDNEIEGPMFKIKDDPRITKVGKFIRKTSIDELPQLLNVLRGEMSLVGPRPPLVREVEEYTEYDKQRLLVNPGCTGIWQVTGRNSIGFDEMVQLDLNYIQNLNIMTDIQILIKTVGVIINPNDAY